MDNIFYRYYCYDLKYQILIEYLGTFLHTSDVYVLACTLNVYCGIILDGLCKQNVWRETNLSIIDNTSIFSGKYYSIAVRRGVESYDVTSNL